MLNLRISLEKTLMGAIFLMFVAPGLLMLCFHYRTSPTPPWMDWLANRTLQGTAIVREPVTFSWPAFLHGKYQAGVAADFNENFGGRELAVRWTNEAWYRLFKTCDGRGYSVVFGQGGTLLEQKYLVEYCLSRVTREELAPMVADIRRFQDLCARRGIAFVFLITPSKVSIYPEYVPARWLERYDPRPRAYDLILPMLKAQGIHFVDGHALALESKARFPEAPVFPKGGTHWGLAAVVPTANAFIAEVNAQGRNLQPIPETGLQVTRSPVNDSNDLWKAMNMALPMDYPVYKYISSPIKPRTSTTVAAMGGSFVRRFLATLGESRQFMELDGYFYVSVFKYSIVDSTYTIVAQPVAPMDYGGEIYGADCVVLEINEEQLPQLTKNNAAKFLPPAFAHAPKEGSPREPFLYERFARYAWGDEISFRGSDPHPVAPGALSGFSAHEPASTWTDGPDAEMRLIAPPVTPAGGDVTLEARLAAFLDEKKHTGQSVTVSVNDEEVGRWTFSDMGESKRRLAIPGRLIDSSGVFFLRFHIDHPVSPAELGLNVDERKLGIRISTLRMSVAGKND